MAVTTSDLIAAADGLSARILLHGPPEPQADGAGGRRDARLCEKYEINVDEGESRSRYFVVAPEQRTRESRSPGEALVLARKVPSAS
jgi:hypothetical protein